MTLNGPLAAPARRAGERVRRILWLLLPGSVLAVLVFGNRLAFPDAALLLLASGGALALMLRPVSRDGAAPPAPDSRERERDADIFAFARNSSEPCILLDRRSTIIYANPSAQGLFPFARPAAPIVVAVRHPVLLKALGEAAGSGQERRIELHERAPTESWHAVTIVPLAHAEDVWLEDRDALLVLTFRNLTEQKRIETLRSDFIANASHELRTPLTSLMGFVETLQGSAANDPEAQKRFLPIMRNQAHRMSRLIDDLLSLSRIEMRQHVRPTGRVDLLPLLREARDGLSAQAADGGVAVELRLPEGPADVAGDAGELYQVFENLIENAIKYGGSGGRVEVDLAPVPDSSGFRVSVTDHGDGIAPEHVPRLTERFYRVDADGSRKKKGTGLGLAIVKHIVQRHRGSLRIASQPGHGTSVEVILQK